MKSFVFIVWVLTLGCWGYMLLMTHGEPDEVRQLPALVINDGADHFLAFGLLGGLLCLSFWAMFPKSPLLLWLALPVLLAYAAIDEKSRMRLSPRTQMHHWLADAAGASVAVTSMYLLCGLSRVLRRSMPPDRTIIGPGGRRNGTPGANAGSRELGSEVESALASYTDVDAEVSDQIIRVERAALPPPKSNGARPRPGREN
jgi:hypothetical protein